MSGSVGGRAVRPTSARRADAAAGGRLECGDGVSRYLVERVGGVVDDDDPVGLDRQRCADDREMNGRDAIRGALVLGLRAERVEGPWPRWVLL